MRQCVRCHVRTNAAAGSEISCFLSGTFCPLGLNGGHIDPFQKSGACGMKHSDRVVYSIDGRHGIALEFTQDGDCTVVFDDGKTTVVKWNHLDKEQDTMHEMTTDPHKTYLHEPLSFNRLRHSNISRCQRWHPRGGVDAWSPERWYTAMMGEAGELGNALKKMFRVLDQIQNINEGERQLDDMDKVLAKIKQEIGDTAMYLDLLATKMGLRLEDCIIMVFNQKSQDYGFPERL